MTKQSFNHAGYIGAIIILAVILSRASIAVAQLQPATLSDAQVSSGESSGGVASTAAVFDDFSTYTVGSVPSGWTQYGTPAINPTVVNFGGTGTAFQRLDFPAYIAESTSKWLIKDGLVWTTVIASTKLNFQSGSDGAGLVLAWIDSSNFVAVLPNPFWDEIVVWEYVNGQVRSTFGTGRGAVPIQTGQDYWLKAVAKVSQSGDRQIEVWWSTDGVNYTQKTTATGLANLTGQAGVGTYQFLSHTLFDDFSLISTSANEVGRIVFASNRDGNQEVYVMNADGSGQIRLTNNAASDDDPAWSPDGTRIAFSSNRDGNQEIYVMNADGSGQTNLTNNLADDFSPAWSPNGSQIAFTSARNGNNEIYVMSANGTNQIRLTNNSADEGVATWSPDNTKIAFHSLRDGNYEIYVMNANGSNQTRLTNNTSTEQLPAWSPDGTHIAFDSDRDGDLEVYVMNADGSAQNRLTTSPGYDWGPAWSPDGTQIAFVSSRDGNSEIYTMSSNGSGQTRRTNNSAGDIDPSWSGAKPWTVIYYLDGDNNLASGYTVPVFNRLEQAAVCNPNVRIVAILDQAGSNDSTYYEIGATQVKWWPKGELNMGNPQTLIDFVNWARANYPAQHYALVLSNHGSGLGGAMLDDTSQHDQLTVSEIGSALASITSNGANKIDLLYMDACLMAMIEDAYQFRNYIDTYVASENIKFGIPDPHLQAIIGLTDTTTSAQLAASLTTTYADACDSSSTPCTMSVASISRLDTLVAATNSLAQLLNSQMATSAITLTNIQSSVQRFEMNGDNVINTSDSYIDLYDFSRLVKAGFDENNIKQAAQAVMDATTAYITIERHRSGITGGHTWNLDNSHGVSVFFPTTASSFYSAGNYDFATGALWPHMTQTSPSQTQAVVEWGPMLVNYFQTTQPGGPDNPIPPQVLPQQILFQVYLPIVLK